MGIIASIGALFARLLKLCCDLTGNFGWAIWVFTLLTRIIMLPVSVVVQKNSIKMVKMYPEMNRFKAMYFGDKEMISEAQYELYKKENYHPLWDLIPVAIQLILLMGVVEGIRALIGEGYPMNWLTLDLSVVPLDQPGKVMIIPVMAAVSALVMCITQNISNVLQSEQGRANKLITLTVSVGLSLYLGLFVPAGIGLYWIAGNLLSIIQMYLLNACINPKRYIDYKALDESKKILEKAVSDNRSRNRALSKDEAARQKADYRRFMKYENKQIVFYSEGRGFYKYFRDVIESIIKRTDIVVHYITSDLSDDVLELESEQFRTYYIGDNKLIVLMMKMDADIVCMTLPDLQRYHIKRSIVRNDIEYIYIDHSIGSMNMTYRKHALDHYDTIFACNSFDKAEIRKMEELYDLPQKKIVDFGYCLIDNMIAAYEGSEHYRATDEIPCILIAPSWQDDNLLDLCIEDILDSLTGKGYKITLRPHPQYIRHKINRINELKEKYGERSDIEFQTDFSSNKTVYDADILMTDWSGIAYEYALTTLKPVLFINTPMKVMNPDYEELGIVPMDIEIRDKIGISLDPADIMSKIAGSVDDLLHDASFTKEEMIKYRQKYLYNAGSSAKAGADYMIKSLMDRY